MFQTRERNRKSHRKQPRQTGRRSLLRRGVATVETAVALPILVFLTFGSIELSNLVFLRQSLAIASYEGVRNATRPGGSQGLAETRIQEVLSARGITNYTVSFTPAITTSTTRGTMVTVTVSANKSNLSYAPFNILAGTTIRNSTTMVRQ